MSGASGPSVTDHELYRVFSFGTWEARETPEETARRLGQLERELQDPLHWMPSEIKLPDRTASAGWKQRIWEDDPPRDLGNGWLEQRVGIMYPEELLVYVGLLRREERDEKGRKDWIRAAEARWEAKHSQKQPLSTFFAMPEEAEHRNRPRAYGQAWVWTGEWSAPPGPDGWEGFGNEVYGPGSFSLFPWGLLGYTDATANGLPRFDLHTTRDDASKARSRFLYWELPRLLTCFLKADQFLRHRHVHLMAVLEEGRLALEELSRRDAEAGRGRNREASQATRERINDVTAQLHRFGKLVADLEVDHRNVALALDEVRRSFPVASRPESLPPWPVDRIDLLARQISADVDYAKITMAASDRLLQKHLIVGELEETRATERLTKLGMIVGAMLGAMQLTGQECIRAIFLAAGVFLCVVLYREELTGWWRRISRVGN